MKAHTIVIKRNGRGRWDIFVDGILIEGGFFTKYAAETAAAEYLTDH